MYVVVYDGGGGGGGGVYYVGMVSVGQDKMCMWEMSWNVSSEE